MHHPRVLTCLALALAATVGTACAAPAAEEEEESAAVDSELRRYVEAGRERPEVGYLRYGNGFCTATLIGPRTVLTAAHCFEFASTVAAASAPALGTFNIQRADGTTASHGFHSFRADATVLEVSFDIAVVQLDVPVSPTTATPATIATTWPSERLTVYGYGRHGSDCKQTESGWVKRKTTTPSRGWVKATSCPGDSGGPYFRGASSDIVATVKGDGLGLEWMGDAVANRSWILARRAESERGALLPQ